jgi:flagella basal body P-ring formation protein FlgA
MIKSRKMTDLEKVQADKKIKVYNVWVIVEPIYEGSDIDEEDIFTEKVAMFKTEDSALSFARELVNNNDTGRDNEGFTIGDE